MYFYVTLALFQADGSVIVYSGTWTSARGVFQQCILEGRE